MSRESHDYFITHTLQTLYTVPVLTFIFNIFNCLNIIISKITYFNIRY